MAIEQQVRPLYEFWHSTGSPPGPLHLSVIPLVADLVVIREWLSALQVFGICVTVTG